MHWHRWHERGPLVVNIRTYLSALFVALIAVSGCGSAATRDDSSPATACRGIDPSSRASGKQISDGVSARALCRARGRPRTVFRQGETVVWDYGCGVTWRVTGGFAQLEVTNAADFFCTPKGAASPRPLPVAPPPDLGARERTRFVAGSYVAAATGCLACHRIGVRGVDAPGGDLSSVGSRLPAAAIAQVLRNPSTPMPSFARLPRRRFADLVFFLAALRRGR